MEGKGKSQDDENANENQDVKSQKSDREDQKDNKKEDSNKKSDKVDFSNFIKTKNDKGWADKNCVYLLDKYVNVLDQKAKVDVDSKLWSIMKDLHVLFRLDENSQIMETAKDDLGDDHERDFKYFKQKMYEWIAGFRELSIATYIGEGLDLISKSFKMNEKQLDKYFKNKEEQDVKSVDIDNFDRILTDVMEII